METEYQHTINGQSVRQQDINSISGNAALADDRTLWEVIRTLPFDSAPQKAVLVAGQDGWPKPAGTNSTALVHSDSGGGKVRVRPCRVIVGATSTTGIDRFRNIRSGYVLPTGGLDYQLVTIAANVSADPRWTLVYAKIEPDKDGDTDTVIVKDVTTGVVGSTPGVVINKKTTVTLGTVDGTAAASPTRPSLPADAAGAYYVALAFLLIPGSFNSATVLTRQRIYEVAPAITIHSGTGALTARPANQQFAQDGTVDTNQSGSGATQYRPGAYLPSTMVGGEERHVLIQNHLTPLSHNDGDVVDDSCDWRFRTFEWTAYAKTGNTTAAGFASDRQATGTDLVPSAWNSELGASTLFGFGQSYIDDTGVGAVFSVADGNGVAAVIKGGTSGISAIGGATDIIMLYVRNTDGALIVKFNGSPDVQVWVRLRATGPYSNFGSL